MQMLYFVICVDQCGHRLPHLGELLHLMVFYQSFALLNNVSSLVFMFKWQITTTRILVVEGLLSETTKINKYTTSACKFQFKLQ